SSVFTSPGRMPNASSFMGSSQAGNVGQVGPALKGRDGGVRLPTGRGALPTLQKVILTYKDIFILLSTPCLRPIAWRRRSFWEASHDGSIVPPAVRRAPRRPEGGGGRDAAAHPCAARRGGADRLRSHRNPAPVAAADFAPPSPSHR